MFANPEKLQAAIPQTHRLRTLSHEECGILLSFLEVNQKDGMVPLRSNIYSTVLLRLGKELSVGLDEDGPDILYKLSSLPYLEKNDHVLVVYAKVTGAYIYIAYSRADERKFKGMVDTYIIEPLDSQVTKRVKMLCIAQEVSSINKRMAETKRIQASYAERTRGSSSWLEDEEHFARLFDEYEAKKARLLNDPLVVNSENVKSLISRYQSKRNEDLSERRKIALTLEVEEKVSDRWDEQARLEDNIELLEQRIEENDHRLECLEELLEELK
jgi:hypothetical protein